MRLKIRHMSAFPLSSHRLLLVSLHASAYWWLRGLFWMLVMFVVALSLLPVEQLPRDLNLWDKAQHALGFGALGLLGLHVGARRPVQSLLGLAVLGACIEVAQSMTGWRYGDWLDWLADVVGLGLGWLALVVWRWLLMRAGRRQH
jgi:VanZ family protein